MFKVFGFLNSTIFNGGEDEAAAEAFYKRLSKGDYGAHNMCNAMILQTDSLDKAVREAQSRRRTEYFDGCIYIWDENKRKWYDPEWNEYVDD